MSKRFIAGAVCPQCRALDRIVIEGEVEEKVQRCVECGYEAKHQETLAGVPRGKPERPTPPRQVSTQTVKIMDLQPESPAGCRTK